ncbi:MAG: prepilin peptidase [Candidatus Omnitrophica bacterium CG11_big_fil_rev_8_21_14_0_20_64_10]|nr:MAG: prepilin peptidase [Candidatus Omnitrophica bacterium CG11_big_fil_rev_8_21_14_0_20_64_10]
MICSTGWIGLAVFVVGLCVGSFLNVCIWRLPAGEQIIRGRSRCRACRKTITWRDNIPLVSFLWLRGRCRFCSAPIAWSYPAVELLTGFFFWEVFSVFGFSQVAGVYLLLGCALIVLSVIDWRTMTLPDRITLPGIGLGLAASVMVPALHGAVKPGQGLVWGLAGLAAGGGTLWVIAWIGEKLFRREAMGGGDIKLMAMVGAVVGPVNALLINFLLAPFFGAIVGLFVKLRFKRDLIPYGPFLALGTAAALFWGGPLITWYRNLLF